MSGEARTPPGKLLDFSGRVVVVSGASRGIGQGIALRFAEAGARVVVGYRTNAEGAADTVERIEAAGGRAVAVGGDVGTREGAQATLQAAIEAFSRLDVVVHNAGTYPLVGLTDMTDEDWRGVIDSNLTSTFLMTQEAVQRMPEGGAIVNIASIEGFGPAPAHSHYTSAKAGVVMHTRSSALELGPKGIRVNAVAPGLTFYPELPSLWPEGVARYEQAAPLGRLVTRDEVADACLFLASDASSGTTGACLTVDAGVTATPYF